MHRYYSGPLKHVHPVYFWDNTTSLIVHINLRKHDALYQMTLGKSCSEYTWISILELEQHPNPFSLWEFWEMRWLRGGLNRIENHREAERYLMSHLAPRNSDGLWDWKSSSSCREEEFYYDYLPYLLETHWESWSYGLSEEPWRLLDLWPSQKVEMEVRISYSFPVTESPKNH